MAISSKALTSRKAEYPVADLILGRWSPRAMSGEEIPEVELLSLLEAAKWAPSAYNEQPWRMLYARRNTPQWDLFFNLMVESNQSWAKNAAMLILFISRKTSSHNGKPLQTHSFDTGAAWQNLALQGIAKQFVVHAMSGFDYERAQNDLKIPSDYRVEALVAVGVPAQPEVLTKELQEREVPSYRRPLSKSIVEGVWNSSIA